MIMFPFSYRTLEMTFNDFLRDNAWWIALAFAGLVLLSVALILLINTKRPRRAQNRFRYLTERTAKSHAGHTHAIMIIILQSRNLFNKSNRFCPVLRHRKIKVFFGSFAQQSKSFFRKHNHTGNRKRTSRRRSANGMIYSSVGAAGAVGM